MSAEVYSEKMNEDIFECLPKIEEVSPIDGECDINESYENESTQEAHPPNDASNALMKLFFLPEKDAARALNIGITTLKKRWRKLGLPRWPHMKIYSLGMTQLVIMVQLQKDPTPHIQKLHDALQVFLQSLRTDSQALKDFLVKGFPPHVRNIRRAAYKYKVKLKR